MRTGEVRYTNAGHNPPCIRRAGGALELLSTRHGPALGVVPGTVYGSGSVRLGDGDTFVLYTDGVTEAENPGTTRSAPGRCCGYSRIARDSSPAGLGKEILQAVDRFAGEAEQADDITLLILRFNAFAEKGAPCLNS